MTATSNRYGLNLNRGLYFEGQLTRSQAGLLGAYAMTVMADPEASTSSVTLKGLNGELMGIVAKPARPEIRRRLTVAPVLGDFCMTSLDMHSGSFRRFPVDQDNTSLTIEGGGVLHIPKLEVYKKYQSLVAPTEYLTGFQDDLGDFIAVTWRGEQGLHFSINIDTPPAS